MLKLKLQYFGHLMRRVDSLEKTLMLGGALPTAFHSKTPAIITPTSVLKHYRNGTKGTIKKGT